jgi:DNA polymerase V
MAAKRTYLAIDLKSFYASVECVDRHLDPLITNLVVADASRTEKTICLAVSPSLKTYKIPGRARLFEAVQRVKEVNAQRLQNAIRHQKAVHGEDGKYHFASLSFDANALNADPSLGLSYIIAPPRMQRYLDVSTQIYKVYLKYVSPQDIYPYSIDEVFIDATGYLQLYKMTAHELAMTMVREVLYITGITATAGIGTNLYLAKLAMDIVAKHIPADKDGVRIAELDEQSYRYLLWNHRPLTDFWMTGPGTVKKLEAHGIYTMGDLARFSVHGEDRLYEIFGVDAELLIDHAWGYEPCGMAQIKSYKPSTNSISEGQVLSCPYPNDKAKLIVREMAETLMFRLTEKKLVTESLTLEVGYDRENVDNGGQTQTDRYGRTIPKAAHGTIRFDVPTNLGSTIITESVKLFERISDPVLTVRRLTLNANKVSPDEGIYQVDFFTDTKKQEKEKKLQQAMLGIKTKYGKNAVLKASSYTDGATMRQRNEQIGGHRAGGHDGKLQNK